MLHEILLSLSGHPSPLLNSKHLRRESESVLSPPEKALLSSVAHLSNLHCNLISHTAKVSASHPSSICQAVAAGIASKHLKKFQQNVLDVENRILRRDAGSVGAYNIVPLTSVVGEFSEWTRRMEWFWELVNFMRNESEKGTRYCTGAQVIDRLCKEVQTGYTDIEEAARSLVTVAEAAWLKQVSTWLLYGRLPKYGGQDFFIQEQEDHEATGLPVFASKSDLAPAFVSSSTAESILFIGRSLNHIRIKGTVIDDSEMKTSPELRLLPSHLQQLAALKLPITTSSLARVTSAIRLSLSQNILQLLLPVSKILETLSLLREFFLLGRGEFAVALVAEAEEKIRSRWRRSENIGYEKRDTIGGIVVKDGEVSAVLSRTWAAVSSFQGEEDDDEELLELARECLQLNITKSSGTPFKSSIKTIPLSSTPFKTLLFSVPVELQMRIPSPTDLFLAATDMQTYSSVNAYLLSIRRAHLRLSGLWKVAGLRRNHPAPPAPPYGSSKAGRAITQTQRLRRKERDVATRNVWATVSSALFFFSETESYFQGEIVQEIWDGFQKWIIACDTQQLSSQDDAAEDMWSAAAQMPSPSTSPNHDPQTLSQAHRKYLAAMATNLLLTIPKFTNPLYQLLQHVDHLVALVDRIHLIWQSLDLEADEGVIDAFSDFHKEERNVTEQLRIVAGRVKGGIDGLIIILREIDHEKYMDYDYEVHEDGAYIPQTVGRIDRLLMKLEPDMAANSRRMGAE